MNLDSIIGYKAEFFSLPTQAKPTQLLPQMLEEMTALGELARAISQALGGNGHEPVTELLDREELIKAYLRKAA